MGLVVSSIFRAVGSPSQPWMRYKTYNTRKHNSGLQTNKSFIEDRGRGVEPVSLLCNSATPSLPSNIYTVFLNLDIICMWWFATTLTWPSGWCNLIKSIWALSQSWYGHCGPQGSFLKKIRSWSRRIIMLRSLWSVLHFLITSRWWAKHTGQELILTYSKRFEPELTSAAMPENRDRQYIFWAWTANIHCNWCLYRNTKPIKCYLSWMQWNHSNP